MALLEILRSVFFFLAICLSTVLHGVVLIVSALFKLLAPEGRAKEAVRTWLTWIAESWVGFNNLLISLERSTSWDLDLPPELDRSGGYVVVCNHQSWVDIVVLQRCFNRRLPLLRFFLKRELIWVPILGLCWWALDFPFMRRASREELKKRPELRGRDLESARQACEKFSDSPVAMMSFPEGTRRRGAKRDQGGDFDYLMRPKAGGIGQVIFALGERLDGCVDVTIDYETPDSNGEPPGFWDLLQGRIETVRVKAVVREIPPELIGRNFIEDQEARKGLQDWVLKMWAEKDALLRDWASR